MIRAPPPLPTSRSLCPSDAFCTDHYHYLP